jgi:hypothetical protein
MKTAILYIRGLNTKEDSDWCGIRTFFEKLAELLGADLIALDYNDDAGIRGLEAKLADYNTILGAGHSHGAASLYDWIKTTQRRLAVAVFIDLCPQWQPFAWMGAPWPVPDNCDKVLTFYQRNDTPLTGVRLAGENVQEYNVTDQGLHHSSMCADERVHDRIALAMLWQHAAVLNAHTKSVAAGV